MEEGRLIPAAPECITCLILCRVEHEREAKPVQVLSFHANADHATGVFYHEGHGLCRDLVRCDDKVALVLPVLVVDDNEELARRQVGQSPGDAVEARKGFLQIAIERQAKASISGLSESNHRTMRCMKLPSDVVT